MFPYLFPLASPSLPPHTVEYYSAIKRMKNNLSGVTKNDRELQGSLNGRNQLLNKVQIP